MANEDLRIKINAMVAGLDQVESLKNAVRQLQNTARPASADLDKLKKAAIALGTASDRTEDDLYKSINALKAVRSQLSLADGEYKKLTNTINSYQRQLDKATGAQGRAGRAAQFGQTAGAIAAGGVFGGPEGLIGGAIGAFTPVGAIGGAAIGAQVNIIRRQLGGTAELAAGLEKQRTALRLVLKDTAEYNKALEFLSKTSENYAIPQDQLIEGFTQLTASVVGAGGNIEDTKIAFEGITAGIRGTGRSLQDLDGALLATSQVFSKGKVSAEELRGQIGERLPGAFTLFAESIGKTPQELDKALERGEVSLQDFLTFAKTVFGEYGENAKVIADSPAAAGDRLQTSLKNLSESVGKLLAPIGASFQSVFADIVKSIDEAAKRLADFLGLNQSNAERMGQLNNLIITQQRAIKREEENVRKGITSKEAGAYAIKQFEARIVQLRGELNALKALDKAAENQRREGGGLAGSGDGQSQAEADKARREAEKARKNLFNELLAQLNAQNKLLAEQGRLNESIAETEIPKAVAAKETADQILENEQKQLDLRLKYGEISRKVYDEQQKAIKIEAQVIQQEFKKTISELEAEAQGLVDSIFGAGAVAGTTLTPLQALEDKIRKDVESARKRALQIGGLVGTEAAKRLGAADIEQIASRQLLSGEFTSLQQQIQDLKDAGKELSTLDVLKRKYLKDWDSLDPVLRGQLELMAAQVDALKKQQEAIEGLRNVAGAIGDAFGNSFKSVITGAATAKEALASFFSSVADYFADMAAKMIAEWIKLAILNTIVRIFNPGAGAASGLSDLGAPATINNPLGVLNANGNAFAANGIVPYAKGGIVNRPTMFKFARGGTMQTGIMGEAGPEAIMPLKRGPDGKLGVQAAGGGGVTVNVSVDAKGTQVQGDPGQGQQLGRVIAGAVQAELIKQQRPGGLLANPR